MVNERCVRQAGERTSEHNHNHITSSSTVRGGSMQRQRFGSDEGPGRNPAEERRLKRPATESEETGDDDELPPGTRRKMKDTQQKTRPSGSTAAGAGAGTASSASSVRAVLQDFLEQQQRLDAQRQEAAARHAQERLALEQQWRQEMAEAGSGERAGWLGAGP
uniref:Uncharacterized protein n=1 Tax=Aegilops tauschii TaxID=37682 RepID=M8AUJ7_AEGTA